MSLLHWESWKRGRELAVHDKMSFNLPWARKAIVCRKSVKRKLAFLQKSGLNYDLNYDSLSSTPVTFFFIKKERGRDRTYGGCA